VQYLDGETFAADALMARFVYAPHAAFAESAHD